VALKFAFDFSLKSFVKALYTYQQWVAVMGLLSNSSTKRELAVHALLDLLVMGAIMIVAAVVTYGASSAAEVALKDARTALTMARTAMNEAYVDTYINSGVANAEEIAEFDFQGLRGAERQREAFQLQAKLGNDQFESYVVQDERISDITMDSAIRESNLFATTRVSMSIV